MLAVFLNPLTRPGTEKTVKLLAVHAGLKREFTKRRDPKYSSPNFGNRQKVSETQQSQGRPMFLGLPWTAGCSRSHLFLVTSIIRIGF